MKSNFLKSAAVGALVASLAYGPVLAQSFNPVPNIGAYGSGGTLVPFTAGLTGSYTKTLVSGTMAAGLAADAPIFSFRYTGTGTAVVKRIAISAADSGTAFTAGFGYFNLFFARGFTASDTGGTAGTLTGNNGKLRTSFGTTAVGDMRIGSTGTLTAGTRTLDSSPIASLVEGFIATAGTGITVGYENLWNAQNAGDYPIVLANNEGLVIQANVPATGTWQFAVQIEWDEYSSY